MAKKKLSEEQWSRKLVAWENARLEPDDDSEDDKDEEDDFEWPEDNVCVDEEGVEYYG